MKGAKMHRGLTAVVSILYFPIYISILGWDKIKSLYK
jgi:hypothetical protein